MLGWKKYLAGLENQDEQQSRPIDSCIKRRRPQGPGFGRNLGPHYRENVRNRARQRDATSSMRSKSGRFFHEKKKRKKLMGLTRKIPYNVVQGRENKHVLPLDSPKIYGCQ
jgi:hypothetical protein